MKKALFFLLAIVALISGCAAASTVSRDENLDSSFAYVTGRMASGQSIHFSLNGSPNIFDSHHSFIVSDYAIYPLTKVYPGRYTASSATLSGDRRLSNNNLTPLATVDLEPGKITYIGDIDFRVNSVSGPGYVPAGVPGFPLGVGGRQSANVSMDVKNNSEAAKNAVRKNFPGLAKELDAIFVYKPTR